MSLQAIKDLMVKLYIYDTENDTDHVGEFVTKMERRFSEGKISANCLSIIYAFYDYDMEQVAHLRRPDLWNILYAKNS